MAAKSDLSPFRRTLQFFSKIVGGYISPFFAATVQHPASLCELGPSSASPERAVVLKAYAWLKLQDAKLYTRHGRPI
jgi:hypothetical protein